MQEASRGQVRAVALWPTVKSGTTHNTQGNRSRQIRCLTQDNRGTNCGVGVRIQNWPGLVLQSALMPTATGGGGL